MRDRIMEYLASGVKANRVASIVGCSASYVSQLVSEDSFKEELTKRMSEQPANGSEISLDNKYDAMEHTLLNAMEDALAGAELPAVTQALRVVADIRLKKTMVRNPVPQNPLGAVDITVVNLTLPTHMMPSAPRVELNTRGEILSINDNNLAPLSSDGVRKLFAARSLQRGAMVREAAPKLQAVPEDF